MKNDSRYNSIVWVNRCKQHLSIFIWLVFFLNVNGLCSMSYLGCHPSHGRTPSFFKMVIAPPTTYVLFVQTLLVLNEGNGWVAGGCWGLLG